MRKSFNSASQTRFKGQGTIFIHVRNAILLLSELLKCGGFDGIIILRRRAWELGSESLVIILQASGTHPVDNSHTRSFIQRVSDLQFVLHHVEGVVREVDLLDAVDDLLLRLGVNGLLPQLPQLLLEEKETVTKRGN